VLPEPLLKGRDVLALGYPAGPRIGEILAWLRERQLEGAVADRDDAVRQVRAHYPLSSREA